MEKSQGRMKGKSFYSGGIQKKQFHLSCGFNSFTRRGGLKSLSDPYPTLAPHKEKAWGSDGARIVAALRASDWK